MKTPKQSTIQNEAAHERGLVEVKRKKIGAQIDEIRSLNKSALQLRWQEMFKKDAPDALTKDLLARMIAYRIQEDAFGGLDRKTEKLLESYVNGKPISEQRYLKSGTVLVREYQGVRHTVTIADGSYIWNDKKYPSLSIIAKEITGTSWNGPKFFGLREKIDGQKTSVAASDTSLRRAEP
ncbi:MAG: DUF2924 domain-containing protein [Xanthobacteraceae bacterium]|nr:DUF2924 domain-containing protein [Xanthobacteraceae bacterium]